MQLFIGLLSVILFGLLASLSAAENTAPVEQAHYYYHAANRQFINEVDSAISLARKDLSLILGDSLGIKPSIYIEDTPEEFRQRIGSAVPDWGAAVALPYKQMIVVKSPAHFRLGKPLSELIKHEYAHLALEDRLRHVEPPRWLNEGLAMYIAFEWGWGSNVSLSQAVVLGSIVPLIEIEKMNRFSEGRAQIAYAQSYMAVKYLLDQYGFESFNILLDRIRDRQSMDDAMMAAIGSNYNGFEKEYLDYLKSRFNLFTIFIDMTYLWLFLAIVVIIGFVIRLRRKKKFYKEWDEYEKYHSTDFDYGDPDKSEQEDDEDKPWA